MVEALGEKLSGRKKEILDRLRQYILGQYPEDNFRFLRNEKDRFDNPVGDAIIRGTEAIFDEITGGMNTNKLFTALDSVIRMRAVQDFSPSEAVSFIPYLRQLLKEEASKPDGEDGGGHMQLIESRMDEAMMIALESYVSCREQIYEIRIAELKKESQNLLTMLERAYPDEKERW